LGGAFVFGGESFGGFFSGWVGLEVFARCHALEVFVCEGVHVIRTPRHAGLLSPIIHTIPVQLLAYHTALKRGTDVDKPRNLAKSVTVE
jgi:glucosamine 6-phosphate synthetase-like amidotransferase/phosphosugar isomerase protein